MARARRKSQVLLLAVCLQLHLNLNLNPNLSLNSHRLAHAQQPHSSGWRASGGGGVVAIPGNEQLLRQASRVDQVVLPYESYLVNKTPGQTAEDFRTANIIDHKRFVEPYSTRCLSSTLLADPDAVEPNFVVVRARSEVRVNATAPLGVILASGFDPKLHTTIIVHGFTQSYPSADWLRRARALFEQNRLVARENLLIMDWGSASSGSYAQVAAMTSGMGSFLANFLMKLLELGAERRAIHLVGHSLGAHLCGFAGKRIRPRLGRITALDPAGPCFGKLFSNSPNDRLSPDDALQVDVLHYDDAFLGLGAPLGHFDVFVNGGSSQPGAVDNVNAMVQALVTMLFRRNRVLSESHTRSTEVATSQLGAGCQEVAYECRDYAAFLSGECGFCEQDNAQCFLMSLHFQYANMAPAPLRRAQPAAASKRLFIATAPSEPFCVHHLQLIVQFEPTPDLAHQAKRNKWRLLAELEDERGARINATLTNQLAPTTFSGLLLLPGERAPAKVRRAVLQVRSGLDNAPVRLGDGAGSTSAAKRRPLAKPFRVATLEVNFMSHVEFGVRQALSARLCPAGWLARRATESNAIGGGDDDDDWLSLEECR